jgi:ketopantoate reductase
MSARDCRPGKTHRFHRVSGWCTQGCGVREDGRVVHRISGEVILSGPDHPPAALDYFRTRAQEMSR